VVDINSNAYITGFTMSSDFPITSGAYDTTYNGYADAFITKLNFEGTDLLYSTYLGGSGGDYGHGIAVDGDGDAYVAGMTSSGDFPTTPSAYDTSFNGGIDVFITKIPTLCDLSISITTGGTTDPEPGTYTYDSGTEVIIEAIPESGYRFSGWTGDVPSGQENDNPITITMDSDKSVTANFIRQYTLTISTGTGGTTDPSPESYIYDVGTQVSVRAIANSGYRFSGWSGDASGTTNPITITMDSDKSIAANFSAIPPTEEAGKKGGCFIATAAYNSALHPYVETLRDFRDIYLMPSKLGRVLVDFYYKYSPFVADLIVKHKALKIVVRISLLPLVAFSFSMVHFGPIITTVMLVVVSVLPIFLILFLRRK